MLHIYIYIYIYDISSLRVKDVLSSSGFVILNAKVTNERCSGQNMDVSDNDLF